MQDGILEAHHNISRYLRAFFINWLAFVCEVLPKDDCGLIFIVTSIMDRFYKAMKV